jgi:signal transduction histidine kinase
VTAPERPRPRLKILVVEDERGSRIALRAALEPLGQELIECSSGEDALRQLLSREVAVILLDIRLPGIDGFETAAAIRERSSLRETPILFLTSMLPDETHVARGYELGAIDYMFKPIIAEILQAKVRVLLELCEKRRYVEEQAAELRALNADLERRVELRTAELMRSNRELEQFAHVASHDLQEPLRMVAQYTQLLSERYQGKLDDKADKYIGYAVDGAKRMQRMIKDLLTFSMIRSQARRPASTDLNEVLDAVLFSMQTALAEAGAEVTAEPRPLPTIAADAEQLGRVLQNLISNAIKFRGADPPRIHLTARATDGGWLLAVADNGIGFEMEYADRIFQMFQRLHERGRYQGTGIGLSIVKHIVERHGGRVWAESQPGEGATFFLLLPLQPPTLEALS